jgi:hypothetical protein
MLFTQMFTSFVDWVLVAGCLALIYLAFRPLERYLERRILRWLWDKKGGRRERPVIDIASKRENKNYEN